MLTFFALLGWGRECCLQVDGWILRSLLSSWANIMNRWYSDSLWVVCSGTTAGSGVCRGALAAGLRQGSGCHMIAGCARTGPCTAAGLVELLQPGGAAAAGRPRCCCMYVVAWLLPTPLLSTGALPPPYVSAVGGRWGWHQTGHLTCCGGLNAAGVYQGARARAGMLVPVARVPCDGGHATVVLEVLPLMALRCVCVQSARHSGVCVVVCSAALHRYFWFFLWQCIGRSGCLE